MAKFKAEYAGQILLCALSGKPGSSRPSVFLLKICLSFYFISGDLNLHQNDLYVPDIE